MLDSHVDLGASVLGTVKGCREQHTLPSKSKVTEVLSERALDCPNCPSAPCTAVSFFSSVCQDRTHLSARSLRGLQ